MKTVNVDEVLKILHKYGKFIFVTDEKKYSDMVDEIANLKALKPKGEWIPKERPTTDIGLYIDIVCSECGYVSDECYAYGYELNEIDMKKVRDSMKELDMNFCPCCGADMRGKADE